MTGKQGCVSKVWGMMRMMIMMALSKNQIVLRYLLRAVMTPLSSTVCVCVFSFNYCLKCRDNSLFALSGCGWNPHQRAWNLASQAATDTAGGMNWNPGELILFETKFDQGKNQRGSFGKCIPSFFSLSDCLRCSFSVQLVRRFFLCLRWPASYWLGVFAACQEVASEVDASSLGHFPSFRECFPPPAPSVLLIEIASP